LSIYYRVFVAVGLQVGWGDVEGYMDRLS